MRLAITIVLAVGSAGCFSSEPAFEGPLRLLEQKTIEGRLARSGALVTGGDTRPALLESARYRLRLPKRGSLTFGMGLSWSGGDEAPGWYRLNVRAGDKLLAERQLNPRAARGFHDTSVPLEELGGETEIRFEIALTDRDGKPVPLPPELLLGVSEPTVHDRDDYGQAKGIILISIDTLRRDHVGAYGYSKPTTPRIDAFARESILCEDAISPSSWTLPAHLSMMTSVDPGAHGGTDAQHGFNHRVPTLASALQRSGYATQAVTSHLYVSETYGLDDGFDHLDFKQDRKATEVTDRGLAILERYGDRPFFLFLHYYDPHWHYDPPEKTLRIFEESYGGKQTGLWQDFKDKTRATISQTDMDHLLALYDGEIRYTDDELGRVLDYLKNSGLDQSVLVIITSDHGEEFLEHGSWEHQKTLYEEVIRIPLLVRMPGLEPRREPAQTSLLDITPTVLAYARVTTHRSQQGKSLLIPPGEREMYGETNNTTDGSNMLFLRAGASRWKMIVNTAPDGKTVRNDEWFDLGGDPGETRQARPYAALVVSTIERGIGRWRLGRERGEGAPVVHLSNEQRERLRALGYVSR